MQWKVWFLDLHDPASGRAQRAQLLSLARHVQRPAVPVARCGISRTAHHLRAQCELHRLARLACLRDAPILIIQGPVLDLVHDVRSACGYNLVEQRPRG